jgi:hypothetical protein
MIKYFVNKWGDKFVFCEALQSLTAPIFLPVEYRLFVRDWDTVADVAIENIATASHHSIEAAMTSMDGVKLEVQYKFIDISGVDQPRLGTLPDAILELHPEHGARLHYIVPDQHGYSADVYEPTCGLAVAADLGFMVETMAARLTLEQ